MRAYQKPLNDLYEYNMDGAMQDKIEWPGGFYHIMFFYVLSHAYFPFLTSAGGI